MKRGVGISSSKPAKTVRVLLINDDKQMSSFISSLLSKNYDRPYRQLRARTLDKSINAIAKNACDIVIMNYYWGKTRIGEKVLKWVKSKKPQLPVIVITKDFEESIDSVAIKLGATDYLAISDLTSQSLDRAVRYALARKHSYDHINYLIHHDHLTSLPNRVLFQNRLRHAIRIAEREEDQFALLLIDLNNFKEINDIYGHDAGDIFLKEFSQRLNNTLDKKGFTARVGDDEFAVILKGLGRLVEIQQLVDKMIQGVSERIDAKGHFLAVHCSIGIAIYPNTGVEANQLLRNADLAMLRAKKETVSSYQFYSLDMEQSSNEYSGLQQQFIKALATNQIGLYFNPRVDCLTDHIVGIEVNPYWSHPEKGLLEYEEFVWNGLDNDIASRFTEWLLATSFEYFKKLKISSTTKLIFNIEFQGLSSAGFPQIVEKHLDAYQMSGDQVEFDLGKVALSKHTNILESCMRRLQSKGVSFGVNHFGTDEHSLSYLKTLPVNILKLNKEYVDEIQESDYDTLMAKALVDFAHSLGKSIVIEGLHSDLPLNNIKALGFDYYKSVFSVDALSLVKLQDVMESPLLEIKNQSAINLIDPKP
ncbi:MAG: diguanylate cyclase domain-containing protein [Cellvibrionaceae bacterium]